MAALGNAFEEYMKFIEEQNFHASHSKALWGRIVLRIIAPASKSIKNISLN
jgi:hypothetical protein